MSLVVDDVFGQRRQVQRRGGGGGGGGGGVAALVAGAARVEQGLDVLRRRRRDAGGGVGRRVRPRHVTVGQRFGDQRRRRQLGLDVLQKKKR